MPANVLAVGLFAVTAAFSLTGLWFLKLKPFVAEDKKAEMDKAFAMAVAIIGIYAFAAGFYILAGEPFRSPYSEFFGLIHVYYGMTLIMGAITVYKGWDLKPVSYLAFLGGIINLEYVYINQTLINNISYPLIFGGAAVVGLATPLASHSKSIWASRVVGILHILLALAAFYVGFNAFYGHMARGLAPPPTPAPAPAK